ncbi:C4-dicarboxylate transporter DcuC [uncultured Cohaesibacter sp.]|uniref:C4-dicarboxylate transporter DcuC n=1 Tax=uncultured Cohaesibacter sp. TaxID=1002546 RepID=UPI00292F6894|nr:C4-dicarboxylate transporter DcuC [uncultured Cohaesibacter sp.]
MIYVGLVIVVATIILLIKQIETRLVLIASGLLMCLLSGNILTGLQAFTDKMGSGRMIEPICSAMGFACVLKLTGCDKQLINFLIKGLKPLRAVIIPATTVVVFLIAIALQSASGIAAAVGAILIPLLISMGVSRAVAASAVIAGTFGGLLNPSYYHFSFVSKLMNDGTTAADLVRHHAPYTFAALATVCITLWLVAKFLKEDKDCFDGETVDASRQDEARIKPLHVVVPVIPLAILLIGSSTAVKASVPWIADIRISHAMLIGSVIAFIVARVSPAKASEEFFNGMGRAYGSILGIIIGAGVFVAGMKMIGLVDAFNTLLMSVDGLAKVAISFGPFLMAVVTGSGEAAAMAFNEAVTPHAPDMGLLISTMGTMAPLGGALGRAMSPIAGATIICAGYAAVSPVDIAKRTALPMILGAIVALLVAFA